MAEEERPKNPINIMTDRKELAHLVYKEYKEMQRATFDASTQWGRWILASLLLIHGGALFGLFTFLSDLAAKPEALAQYQTTVWCFVAGLMSTLLAGFCTWVNWSLHTDDYNHQANMAMLWDPNAWLRPSVNARKINAYYYAAIVFGFISAGCIIGGAYSTLNGKWVPKVVATALA